jgi:hypothetical protein
VDSGASPPFLLLPLSLGRQRTPSTGGASPPCRAGGAVEDGVHRWDASRGQPRPSPGRGSTAARRVQEEAAATSIDEEEEDVEVQLLDKADG